MTQCAKIIVGFMANVGNVFYPTFTNVFFNFLSFYVFDVFLNFNLNVYYINCTVCLLGLTTDGLTDTE